MFETGRMARCVDIIAARPRTPIQYLNQPFSTAYRVHVLDTCTTFLGLGLEDLTFHCSSRLGSCGDHPFPVLVLKIDSRFLARMRPNQESFYLTRTGM